VTGPPTPARRKRRGRAAGAAARADAAARAAEDPSEAAARGYARSRERDAVVREQLAPLPAGARPTVVTVAALAAAALAATNLVALVARFDPDEGGKTVGSLAGSALLALLAGGMWRARYWAVLAFEALLGVSVVLAALALLTAANAAALVLALAIVLAAGTLFVLLVKAMARIQMPDGPGPRPR
jgi:hypothetical protein